MDVWEADGEVLQWRGERNNLYDPYAVAVAKNDTIIEHVPRKLSVFVPSFVEWIH